MKRYFIIVTAALFLASVVMPVHAADKRSENNKNIAEFVLDTVKLPMLLIGAFVKQDYEQAKKDLDYKEHKGLEKCLRK